MRKTVYLMFALILSLGSVCAGCRNSYSEVESQSIVEESEKELQLLQASWSTNYGTLENIVNESDVIALIEVTGIESVSNLNSGVPMTVFNSTVSNGILGTSYGQELRILQTGGETDTHIIEFEDDPLLETGEKYLIFAKNNGDGTVRILGGPQGRLVYENEQFTSLDLANARMRSTGVDTLSLNISNKDAQSLYDEIEMYLNN